MLFEGSNVKPNYADYGIVSLFFLRFLASLQLCNQRDERLLLECLFPVISVIFIPEDCVFLIELN